METENFDSEIMLWSLMVAVIQISHAPSATLARLHFPWCSFLTEMSPCTKREICHGASWDMSFDWAAWPTEENGGIRVANQSSPGDTAVTLPDRNTLCFWWKKIQLSAESRQFLQNNLLMWKVSFCWKTTLTENFQLALLSSLQLLAVLKTGPLLGDGWSPRFLWQYYQ